MSLAALGRRGDCSAAVGTFGASEDDGAGDLDALDVPGRVIVAREHSGMPENKTDKQHPIKNSG